jgi:DNA-binding winged helix-turn-helix (wHTH) protein
VQAYVILASIHIEMGKLKLGYENVMEALKLAIAQSYYDLIAICYKLLSYFFKHPLFDVLREKINNELKIQSLDDVEILYEKYLDQVTEQQKDFISLFKEPDFESQHYSFHVTKDSGIDIWDYKDYASFVQNGMNDYDIVIDVATGYIYTKDKGKLEFDRHHLLFRLLTYLIQNKERIVSKKELINSVWHEQYDSLMHDQLIYVTVNKLRKQIEGALSSKESTFIRNSDEGYFINKKTKFCFIERSLSMDGNDLNYRQKWILEYLVDSEKITNKEFVNYFKINRTTAFQELDDLVSKDLLERKGIGRSTYYTFKNKALFVYES